MADREMREDTYREMAKLHDAMIASHAAAMIVAIDSRVRLGSLGSVHAGQLMKIRRAADALVVSTVKTRR